MPPLIPTEVRIWWRVRASVQNELRKIRNKAQEEGYIIQKASIEDATVKY